MPSHQERREPLPKGYQFGDAGRDSTITTQPFDKVSTAGFKYVEVKGSWRDDGNGSSDDVQGVPV